MEILVVGSGGREHALCWKLMQSRLSEKIYCAPGNAGIAEIAECVDIKASDLDALLKFALDKNIDLTVVGPEVPLTEGIVDIFEAKGLKIFGPSKTAARLEASKSFAKEVMKKFSVPTARFQTFRDARAAKKYINNFPVVIKANGLAAGKGVIIAKTKEEAFRAVDDIMEKKIFASAGNEVVIEECLEGEEASILAVADGENFILLASSQDHKRIFDNDQGPNTGGMGAYSPAPVIDEAMRSRIEKEIIAPVIEGMKKEGSPFKGILYAGIMVTKEGPKVLEFNVRFGDPETQAVLPRMKSDLVEICLAAIENRLDKINIQWKQEPCVCVVLASEGYPGKYEKGKEISGPEKFVDSSEVIVFHAGTKKESGRIKTDGGRVLGVTALGKEIKKAINNCYEAIKEISFEGMQFRKDIGQKAIERR